MRPTFLFTNHSLVITPAMIQTQQSPLTADDEHTTAPSPTKLFFGEKANTQEPLAMSSLNDQIEGTSVDNHVNNQEASATIGVYAFSEPSEIIRMVRPKKSSISYSLLTKETNRPPSSSSSTCQCYYTSLPDMRNFSGKNCHNGRPLLAKRPMPNRLSDEDDQASFLCIQPVNRVTFLQLSSGFK